MGGEALGGGRRWSEGHGDGKRGRMGEVEDGADGGIWGKRRGSGRGQWAEGRGKECISWWNCTPLILIALALQLTQLTWLMAVTPHLQTRGFLFNDEISSDS